MPEQNEAKSARKILVRIGRWFLFAFVFFWIILGIFALLPIKLNVETTAFPRDIGGQPDVIVVLVHGTFSPRAEWTQPTSSLVRAIQNEFQDARLQFYRYDWPGLFGGSLNNTHFQRYAASLRLAEFLGKLRSDHPTAELFVIAHSHGGNVALYATKKEPRVDAIVTMGTPFIEITPRALKDDITLLWSVDVIVSVAWYAMLLGSGLSGLAGMAFGMSLFERHQFYLKVLGGGVLLISIVLVSWPVQWDDIVWVPSQAGKSGEGKPQLQFKISERAEKIRTDWNKAVIESGDRLAQTKQSESALRLNASMPASVAMLCLGTKGGDEALHGLRGVLPKFGWFATFLSSPYVASSIIGLAMAACWTAGLFFGGRLFFATISNARKEGELSFGVVSITLVGVGTVAYGVTILFAAGAIVALSIIAPVSVLLRAPAAIPFLISYGSTDLLAEYVSSVSVKAEPLPLATGQNQRCEVKEYDFPDFGVSGPLKHSQYYNDPGSIRDIAEWLHALHSSRRRQVP
jgi:pimeloyl-ACP methyl ester carboxylesterase